MDKTNEIKKLELEVEKLKKRIHNLKHNEFKYNQWYAISNEFFDEESIRYRFVNILRENKPFYSGVTITIYEDGSIISEKGILFIKEEEIYMSKECDLDTVKMHCFKGLDILLNDLI